MKNYTIKIHWRTISYLFRKDWYSLARWNTEIEGKITHLIDIGCVTIALRTPQKSDGVSRVIR